MLDANKLQQAVDQAYTQFHSLNGGQNADYIPFLANVPGQLAAVAIVTCDGTMARSIVRVTVITALRWNPSRKSVR